MWPSWAEDHLASISIMITLVSSVCFGILPPSSNNPGVCGAVVARGDLKQVPKRPLTTVLAIYEAIPGLRKYIHTTMVLPRQLLIVITPKPLEYHFRVIHSNPPQQLHSNSRTHCRIQPGPLQCPASFPPAVCVAAPTHDLDPTGKLPDAYH